MRRGAGRLAAASALLAASAPLVAAPPTGLWLLPRKDPGNTARADVPGRMRTAPREVWSFGGGGDAFAWCRPVTVGGRRRYFGLVRTGLRLVEPDGRRVWSDGTIGASQVLALGDLVGDGRVQALVALGQSAVTLVDVADGRRLWSWSPPSGAYLGSVKVRQRPGDTRFVCFVQNTLIGVCFRLTGTPEKLWEKTYAGAWSAGYGPQIVLADMDNDGGEEVVVSGKPGYVGVVDLDTGAMRTQLHYAVTDGAGIGRPYGLLHVEDVDGDGYRDVVMVSCQVEEYIGLVKNVGGKTLAPLWSQFVEQDYPTDVRELRPNVTSVADIDGDGRKELVVGLFNVGGDGQWRTVAFDAVGGWRARKLDLPGRSFWGCHDLDGDGRPEVVTRVEAQRRAAPYARVVAVDGRSGRDVGAVDDAALSIHEGPFPPHAGFMAYRATPVFVHGPQGGLALRRRQGTGPEELWRIVGGKGVFTRWRVAPGARTVALSSPRPVPGEAPSGFVGTGGVPGPDAGAARVAVSAGRRELILALSDGRTVAGQPDWKRPGRFSSFVAQPGGLPAAWVGPDGVRTLVTTPDRDTLHLGRPGQPLATLRLPFPLYRMDPTTSGPTILPFGDTRMRLFVGLQTGVHTLACALYDADGRELWRDATTGPYPRSAAVGVLTPGGPPSLVVNDHYNKAFFGMDGAVSLSLPYGTRRGAAHISTPYALPIVGPFGPDGAVRIVFAPGLDTVQVCDGSGTIVASRAIPTYAFEYCGSAVARLRPGAWDLGMADHDGVFHCVALETAQTRWTLDLGARAPFAHAITACDVDGDGRDNFLVGLPDGRLLALDERDGRGVVLWTKSFPAAVKDAFGADVDGDGVAELVVETDDGRVRVLREAASQRAQSGGSARR